MPRPRIITRRPAEVTTGAAGLGVLIAYALGIDDATVVVALGAVVAALPAVVTGVVEWRRRHQSPEPGQKPGFTGL